MKNKLRLTLKWRLQVVVLLVLFLHTSKVDAQCQANFTKSFANNGLVNLVSTSTNTSANTHYSWAADFSQISTSITTSHTFTNNGVHVISLNIIDSTSNPICYNTKYDSLVIHTVPSPSNALCHATFTVVKGSNGAVTFSSTSTGTTSSTIYQWSFTSHSGTSFGQGGGLQPTKNFTYTSNGKKWVCLTITNGVSGCSSSFCDSTYVLTVNSTTCNPTVMYTMYKDTTQAFTWNAFPNYPLSISGATWYWGDGTSTTGLYPSHTYSAAGTYSTCVTVSVSCGTITAQYCYVANIFRSSQDNSMVTVNVKPSTPTGLRDYTHEKSFEIYPNPSEGLFTINFNPNLKSTAMIEVTNLLGEQVYQMNCSTMEIKEINITELPAGYYVLKVSINGAAQHQRILIQK